MDDINIPAVSQIIFSQIYILPLTTEAWSELNWSDKGRSCQDQGQL